MWRCIKTLFKLLFKFIWFNLTFNFSFTRLLKFITAPYSEVILNLNLQYIACFDGSDYWHLRTCVSTCISVPFWHNAMQLCENSLFNTVETQYWVPKRDELISLFASIIKGQRELSKGIIHCTWRELALILLLLHSKISANRHVY